MSSGFTKTPVVPPAGPPMIGALMRLPWEAVVNRMLSAVQARGFEDIDGPRLGVFLWPGPEGRRPSDLAAHMRVTKQALNYLLGDLERLGYLRRRRDPEDRRARKIVLTARGKSLVVAIREAVAETERQWAEEIGAGRFEQLRGLLVELNEIVARDDDGS